MHQTNKGSLKIVLGGTPVSNRFSITKCTLATSDDFDILYFEEISQVEKVKLDLIAAAIDNFLRELQEENIKMKFNSESF